MALRKYGPCVGAALRDELPVDEAVVDPRENERERGEHHEAPRELVQVDEASALDHLRKHVEHHEHQDRAERGKLTGHDAVHGEGHEVGGGEQRRRHAHAHEVQRAATLHARRRAAAARVERAHGGDEQPHHVRRDADAYRRAGDLLVEPGRRDRREHRKEQVRGPRSRAVGAPDTRRAERLAESARPSAAGPAMRAVTRPRMAPLPPRYSRNVAKYQTATLVAKPMKSQCARRLRLRSTTFTAIASASTAEMTGVQR